MSLERSINFFAYRSGKAFGADHDYRVQMVRSGTVLLALSRRELDR